MADFMRFKYENPKLKQSEIANQLGMFSGTIQRYRNDIYMLSPYRINPNNTNKRTKKAKNTNFDDDSQHEADVERLQMTSNDFKRSHSTSNENNRKAKTKNNLEGGTNIEINEHCLNENLKNNDT